MRRFERGIEKLLSKLGESSFCFLNLAHCFSLYLNPSSFPMEIICSLPDRYTQAKPYHDSIVGNTIALLSLSEGKSKETFTNNRSNNILPIYEFVLLKTRYSDLETECCTSR
jgi:hypothetical protein